MPLLLILIAVLVVFGAYSWYRHVLERESLALLREADALAARQAWDARHTKVSARELQLSASGHRR